MAWDGEDRRRDQKGRELYGLVREHDDRLGAIEDTLKDHGHQMDTLGYSNRIIGERLVTIHDLVKEIKTNTTPVVEDHRDWQGVKRKGVGLGAIFAALTAVGGFIYAFATWVHTGKWPLQ